MVGRESKPLQKGAGKMPKNEKLLTKDTQWNKKKDYRGKGKPMQKKKRRVTAGGIRPEKKLQITKSLLKMLNNGAMGKKKVRGPRGD